MFRNKDRRETERCRLKHQAVGRLVRLKIASSMKEKKLNRWDKVEFEISWQALRLPVTSVTAKAVQRDQSAVEPRDVI